MQSTVIRLPVVGVMGSGQKSHRTKSAALGQWLATLGVHLLSGGGGGIMREVSRAFAEVPDREGRTIAVVPGDYDPAGKQYAPLKGYPNPWVELPVYTHLPHSGELGSAHSSRNHINILSSDVIVFLPGGLGTLNEARLSARYRKPAVAWLGDSDLSGEFPKSIRIAKSFEEVQAFVTDKVDALWREIG